MNTRSPRAGDAVRIVLVVAFILLAIPALLISLAFLGYRANVAQAAEEAQRAEMAQRQAVRALERAQRAAKTEADDASLSPPIRTGSQMKPVTETEYRRESVQTYQPVKDPVTGRITYQPTQTERLVPVMRTRFLRDVRNVRTESPNGPTADPSVTRLLAELQDMDESVDAYDRKMQELRTRLSLQFDSMHEAQANEIAKTEERLESLRELHRKRGERKDEIVQRRMDELLGRDDALRWEIAPSPAIDTPNYTPNYSTPVLPPQALAPRMNLPTGDAFVPSAKSPDDSGDDDITVRAWPPLPPLPPSPPTPPAPVSPPAAVPIPDDRLMDELMAPQIELDESRRPMILEEEEIELDEETQDPGLSSPTIVRLFELARQLSSAQISAEVARDQMKRLEKLVKSGALTTSEFKQESARLARIEHELQLHQMELEALEQALRRNQQAAAAELSAVYQELRQAHELYKLGSVDLDRVSEVEARRKQALVRAEEAKTNIDYLERIGKLLSDQEEEEEEGDSDASEDQTDTEGEANEEGDPKPQSEESSSGDPPTVPDQGPLQDGNKDELGEGEADPPGGQSAGRGAAG